MKKRALLDEVRKMQKIAGLLKEDDDLDLSDMPEFAVTVDRLLDSPSYTVFISDDSWEQTLFALADYGGSCYWLDIASAADEEDDEPEPVRLKPGLTVEKIVAEGEKRGFFEITEFGNYVDTEKELEVYKWIDSLKA
jgi:hypothetical protein